MTVVVGFLHPADSINPKFRKSLTEVYLRDAYTTQRILGEFDYTSGPNIAAGRCAIVTLFLNHPAKPDWLWMVDSDMTFDDDILDRLEKAADPVERPIVGALCFGVRPVKVDGVEQFDELGAGPLELFPTIYMLDRDGNMWHYMTYPRDELVQVHSTGAACVLVHRSVLADERWQLDHPLPWFRESVHHGQLCSEDHFFMVNAGAMGYPIFVDTSVKTGHVKSFVAGERLFLAQRGQS